MQDLSLRGALRRRSACLPAHGRSREVDDRARSLQRFATRVLAEGLLSQDDLERADGEVARHIEEAVKAAEAAPLPEVDEVTTDVYAPATGAGTTRRA